MTGVRVRSWATQAHTGPCPHLLRALALFLRLAHPQGRLAILCLNVAPCVCPAGRPYHGAGELLAVADVRLAVQPDLGELGDVAEAEGVELERGPVGFPILMHKDGIVRGTPVLCVEKQCQSPHGFSETSPEVTV